MIEQQRRCGLVDASWIAVPLFRFITNTSPRAGARRQNDVHLSFICDCRLFPFNEIQAVEAGGGPDAMLNSADGDEKRGVTWVYESLGSSVRVGPNKTAFHDDLLARAHLRTDATQPDEWPTDSHGSRPAAVLSVHFKKRRIGLTVSPFGGTIAQLTALLAVGALAIGCLIATSAAAQAATASKPQPLKEWLWGAWVMENSRCSDGATVYLPTGRLYSAPTPKGFQVEGEYALRGDVLTTHIRPTPAFRHTDPRWIQYNKTLTDSVRVVRRGPTEMTYGYVVDPGPGYSHPRYRRCPEEAGVEPWFPKTRYRGFRTVRTQ